MSVRRIPAPSTTASGPGAIRAIPAIVLDPAVVADVLDGLRLRDGGKVGAADLARLGLDAARSRPACVEAWTLANTTSERMAVSSARAALAKRSAEAAFWVYDAPPF
jgi:hypothetical protein